MRVLIISCSLKGYQLMRKLENEWLGRSPEINIICKVKCSALSELSDEKSICECVGERFSQVDAIVFICAAGIAVRSIAPYIKHKSKDPAVLVIDEACTFCISLLSGHAGGANALTTEVALMLGAAPVITTATDCEHKFAVDEFARKNDLVIKDWQRAKEISVRILSDERLGIYSELPIEGRLPKELYYCQDREIADICISWKRLDNMSDTLLLIPKRLAVGIGCRKGVPQGKIESAIERCLYDEKIYAEAIFTLASIDLKKQEAGIIDYCNKSGIPFLTYPPEVLQRIQGEFIESDFVEQVTGVSNVCERSAVAAAGGRLLVRKRVYSGVTVALAAKERGLIF